MATLNEHRTVECPYVRAREYLSQMLAAAAEEGRIQRLKLTAPLEQLGTKLEKTVLVTYAAGADPMHFDEPWRVYWTPEDGGPYPDFNGELTVRADEGYDSAILELAGSYTPPLGTAGRAFDATIGRRIASATAQHLLADLGAQMITRYRNEEEAKKLAQSDL